MSGQYWLESEPLSIFKYPCSGIHCAGLGEIMPGGTILWAGEATPGTIARWDIPQFFFREPFYPKFETYPHTDKRVFVLLFFCAFLLKYAVLLFVPVYAVGLTYVYIYIIYIYIFMFSFQKITCFNNVQDLNVKPCQMWTVSYAIDQATESNVEAWLLIEEILHHLGCC